MSRLLISSPYIARLIVFSDHCIEQFGQCSTTFQGRTGQFNCILPSDLSSSSLECGGSLQETYTRQLHSNGLINEFASSPGSQTVDESYNGCSHEVLSWQSSHTIGDTRCAEGVAVEQSPDTLDPKDLFGFNANPLFVDMNVLFDASLSGYHSVDECFDYGLTTMANSVSQGILPPTIRHTADEVSAHNSQSSFCSNYAFPEVKPTFLFHSLDAFHATDEFVVYPQLTPSEVSTTSEERSSRQSSSSQGIDDTLEAIPVGKIRIEKQSPPRRRHVPSPKRLKCATCSKIFKHEKDLVRHEARSCANKNLQNKPFVCTCDQRYKRKDDLQKHIKNLNSREKNNRHKIRDLVPKSTSL